MKPQQDYTTANRPGDHGTYTATHLPSICNCHNWGRTPDQARGELIYVVEMMQPEYEEQERSLLENVETFFLEEERHQLA
jgi:predicted RNase H-like HicB family nuclease